MGVPASACFKILMIKLSEYLDVFIENLLKSRLFDFLLLNSIIFREDYHFFIKLAISIREIPNKICQKSKERKPPFSLENFTLLEKNNTQIAFGLIGQFWKSDYGQVKFEDSEEFLEFEKFDYVKLVLYFNINQININSCHVTTETRVLCLGEKALINFRPYWYLIRPVSGFIRYRILLQIQKNIKKSNNVNFS